MSKTRMRDVVVIVPGITGSGLQKDGKDVWSISGGALWSALASQGDSLRHLNLHNDDPTADDLGDGIAPSRLAAGAHWIPGLWKIDGYSGILRMLSKEFDVVPGTADARRPANLLEFTYDWRRDNRVAARRLQQLVNDRLPVWREATGFRDAKVIVIAHSMGGLVARYYTEVLGGWHDCKSLITFGTPHRGSLKALDYLVNGYKNVLLDLTETVRTFTSLYQLLPIYRAIEIDGAYHRAAEVNGLPNVDRVRAAEALAFHREIEAAVSRNRSEAAYHEGYKTIPVVGTHQRTFQAARLDRGKLSIEFQMPTWIDNLLNDGDGTVPRLSAIPIELSSDYRDTFIAEKHCALHTQSEVLGQLAERLKQVQIPDLAAVRGPEIQHALPNRAALNLDVEDLYLPGEPVRLGVELLNSHEDMGGVEARIEPVTGNGAALQRQFEPRGEQWALEVEDLPPDVYRVEVRTRIRGPRAPMPVHDLFEVAGAASLRALG